jgi:hypothetical protein
MDKIDKPGVYEIDMETYHGDCCVGPSISSSGLREIESRSPAHYFAHSYLNADRVAKTSSGFALGSAAHALILGDEVFAERHIVSPFDAFRTNEAKMWRDDMQRAGKMILKQSDMDTVAAMAGVLKSHPLIQQGILEGEVEKSLLWTDPETGVWLKARPDTLPREGWLVDYKTTNDASDRALDRTICDYGYHMQLALAAEGMAELGLGMPSTFALIFQETSAPFAVRVVEIDPDFIFLGAQQNRRAIRKFWSCVDTGEWPAYAGERTATVPRWLEDRLSKQEDANELPKPGRAFTTLQDQAA